MWNEVYVEAELAQHQRVRSILSSLGKTPIIIERYDEIWGRSKRPYLHKRDGINLFLARKRGQLLRPAPPAYGQDNGPHFYYIHAFNCIYECQYCYLQGYFNTPDIVLFVNHEEILQEMQQTMLHYPEGPVWFHAGEFSDSLALSHLSGELAPYHQFCREHPRAHIELRTKSVNIRELLKLSPLPNFIVSFSLSGEKAARVVDLKTPSISARLKAMEQLKAAGHPIAAHFDPIIYDDQFKASYQALLTQMQQLGLTTDLRYLSLGVVRFTKDVHREVERNYPDSMIHSAPMVKSFDNKVRYQRPMRMWMLNTVKELCLSHGVRPEAIYLCMEEHA
jgi:spore photoproduct lyase